MNFIRVIIKQVKSKKNKKQFNYYAEGQVRKMFTGGFLPALFELDETRRHTIHNFQGIGDSWAYFAYWQKYQKRKVSKEKVWDVLIKTGSILGILLSIIKLFDFLKS